MSTKRIFIAEIFRVGCWNNHTFGLKELEEIQANFYRLKDWLIPPLKIGHSPQQTLLGQADGDPALGQVTELHIEKDRLLALFSGVPQIVYDAIQENLYSQVSAEIFIDYTYNGAKLGRVLKGVAILGADLPAVNGLSDLSHYLSAGTTAPSNLTKGLTNCYTQTFTQHLQPFTNNHEEKFTMKNKPDNPNILAQSVDGVSPLPGPEQPASDPQSIIKRYREINEVSVLIRQLTGKGLLLPHVAQTIEENLLTQLNQPFDGSEIKINLPLSVLKKLLGSFDKQLPQTEVALSQIEQPALGAKNVSEHLARKASNLMIKRGIDYEVAAEFVLQEDGSVVNAYKQFIKGEG